ncbi:MAG TPA: lysophospholipid acyltransferase family protein [Candidatus Angelobacter sp.]|nr:lysophospholipid acyltransferase family protein [Candidatus Angelobacter sp.]
MSALISPTRRFLRVTRRFAVVGFAVFACLFQYLLNALTGRTALLHRMDVLHRWSARVLPWLGVSFAGDGMAPAGGLLVSNHLSYLDILVFSALAPCVFVAKREIKGWPGIGLVATLAGTIYIDRSRPHNTHSIQPQMAAALAGGVRVVLFPEGTSSNGRQVLPFRSSLFQPAIENRTPITAACISYEIEDGDPAVDVCYYGDMVLGTHAARLFSKGGITANLRFGGGARVFTDRKEAARQLYEEVNTLRNQTAALISRAGVRV